MGTPFVSFGFAAASPGLLAGWTERRGGVSEPPYDELNLALHVGDDPDAVVENRRRVADSLGVELESFVVAEQTHGAAVHAATEADRGRGAFTRDDEVAGTDALITRTPGLVLAVMLADCAPLVLYDPATPAVGVVHAGWAGTVQHVAREAVEAMARSYGTDPASLVVAIGPSIGPGSYEVGSDVAERALAEFPGREVVRPRGDGKWLFDLWESNIADLESAGVRRENVELAGIDTYVSTDRIFSHRRGHPTGRFMAVASLGP